MANIVKVLEDRLIENNDALKTYASPQFAEAKAETLAAEWGSFRGTDVSIDFIPVFLPRLKRWTVIFNVTEFMDKANQYGPVFYFNDAGFWQI